MSLATSFYPKITHPFFFIRRGLHKSIEKRASKFSGFLLDFGCGQKPYKTLFNVDQYIGLDYENPGHDHKNENIDVFYDGKNIPFENEYFDCVLCSEVFEHLFDINYTLNEINRVLKKDGKLLVTCPFAWNEHEVPHDYARYTIFALKHLFNKHNFKILDYEKKGSFIEAIAQIKVLNFYNNYSPLLLKLPGGRFLSAFVICLLNFIGVVKNFLFPKRYDFYLSNIFLVQKL